MVHHRELARAFVSHWLHRNELQWVSEWPTTENWIEHLYHIGYTKMKYSGCKVDPPQSIGSSMCITNWLHRNEMQWVQGWSTTESWIEHLYHIGNTEMKYSGCKVGPPQRVGSSSCITLPTLRSNTVGARLVHHRELDRACVSQAGYTEMKYSGCKAGPPQRAGSSICITNWLHRNEMQWVQGWSTTESWVDHLYHKLATPK